MLKCQSWWDNSRAKLEDTLVDIISGGTGFVGRSVEVLQQKIEHSNTVPSVSFRLLQSYSSVRQD